MLNLCSFFYLLPIIRYMLRSKVLISICAGTFLYVVLSVFVGQNGIWAMRQLEEQKRTISLHTAEIARTNDELLLEYTALKQDMAVVAAYARRLGYVAEGEKLVKISGLTPYYEPLYDYGSVMKSTPITFVPEWICKLSGYVSGLLVFVVLVLKDLARRTYIERTGKKSYVAGVNTESFESIAGIKVEPL